jgi:hypothetical protein
MKFGVAWDYVEKENRNLKIFSVSLLLAVVFLALTVMGTASQTPLIIERACHSRVLDPSNANPSEAEMKNFARDSVAARFNSIEENLELLSIKQRGYRSAEQEELNKQRMKQIVFVNDVSVEKDGLSVDADRLISFGDIRSSFKFPLKIKLERTSRSAGNPYGLAMVEIEQIKIEVKK